MNDSKESTLGRTASVVRMTQSEYAAHCTALLRAELGREAEGFSSVNAKPHYDKQPNFEPHWLAARKRAEAELAGKSPLDPSGHVLPDVHYIVPAGAFKRVPDQDEYTISGIELQAAKRRAVAESAARVEAQRLKMEIPLWRDETRVTDPVTGGQKGRKGAQLGGVDPAALLRVAEVAGFGGDKYARYNFAKGYNWSLSFDALQRHMLMFWNGEDLDSESHLPHLAHAAWHCLALLTFMDRGLGTDDRFPQTPQTPPPQPQK